jgi:hypothetical protein
MQNGHRGVLPGHILVGAIIGEGTLPNKGKTSCRDGSKHPAKRSFGQTPMSATYNSARRIKAAPRQA